MGSLCYECQNDAQCAAGLKCESNQCMIPGYRYACPKLCLGGTILHMGSEYPYEVMQCHQKPLTENMRTDRRSKNKKYYCDCSPGATLKTDTAFRYLFDLPTGDRPRTIYATQALWPLQEFPNYVCDGYWTFDSPDQWDPITATCNVLPQNNDS